MPPGGRVDAAIAGLGRVSRHMRRQFHVAAFVHELCRAQSLVAVHRDAAVIPELPRYLFILASLGPRGRHARQSEESRFEDQLDTIRRLVEGRKCGDEKRVGILDAEIELR